MGRPLHRSERLCGTGLVSGYIDYIGTREPNNLTAIRNGDPHNPVQASLVVGASCLLLVHGIEREADHALANVRTRMRQLIERRGRLSSTGSSAVQLVLIATMLLDRHNPDAAKEFQLASHQEDITDLRVLRPLQRRSGGHAGGLLAEHSLNGLATRYAGPGTLAVRALVHHDQGNRRADNTDILVVNCASDGTFPTQRAQLKQGCMGFCGDEDGERYGDKTRGQYMEDIVLVSGHCDVLDPESGHSMNGLGRRLELEARGEATPEQIAMLDEATLHVLQVITDPEAFRMGTLPLGRSVEYSFGA